MAFSWSAPRDELSCPVCKDTFRDPVLLPCSHSFCNTCVSSWWTRKPTRECPVCKTVSSTGRQPRNLVLKNLCEAFLLEVESGLVCQFHTEKLKLYCLDHQKPVCVICRDSIHHANHRFTPVDEAAERCRRDLREELEPLRKKVKLFSEVKASWETRDENIKIQAQEVVDMIKFEFAVLKSFLQSEEKSRIRAVVEDEGRKRNMMKDMISVLTTQINSMESTIKTIEEGLSDEDTSLLLKANALTQEAQRPLPVDPQQVTLDAIDAGKHLGNLSFNTWYKMKDIVSFSDVILDPNTAHRELHLSDGLTGVKWGPALCPVQTPERMEHHRCVLGHKGYNWGSHSWVVEVGDNSVWALGVMAKEARMKGDILSGLWMVRFCNGKLTAFSPSRPVSVLSVKDRPWRVRVHLDWSRGKLSFSDPDTNGVIHTFKDKFTHRLFPYINTWNDLPLKIMPKALFVTIG